MKRLIAILGVLLLSTPIHADHQTSLQGGGGGGGVSPDSAFAGQLLGPAADNCAAPPYSFSGDTDTGVCSNVAGRVTVSADTAIVGYFDTSGFHVPTGAAILFDTGTGVPRFSGVATSTVELRGDTGAFPSATLRIYNADDFIDSEFASLGWSSNAFVIGAGVGGSGVLRDIEFSSQTNISGPDATTNVEIGSRSNNANAGTGGTCVAVGNAVNNTGNPTNCVAIGSGASVTGNSGVALGGSATAAISGIALGPSAAAAASSVAIGAGGVATTAANQFVAGSSATPMVNVYFGKGVTNATATAYSINGVGGSGTDNAGANLNLAAGRGTGTAAGGLVVLQGSRVTTTGTTAQTLEDRFYIVSRRFNLTDNTIATFSTMDLQFGERAGGGTISYCVVARDATTHGSECGEVDYAGVDPTAGAGGEVCPTPTKQGTPLQALSGSTLTVTFAASTGTDLCNLRVTADTNIATPTALYIVWNASNPGGRSLTPQ